MSDDDKTSIISGDTLELKLSEVGQDPPALLLLMGPAHQVGKQWQITKESMLIGRAVDAHIFIDDRSVSKNHARITVKGDEVFISDLNSTNGTAVADQRLEAQNAKKLRDNDHIKAGNIIFKFLEKGNIEAATSKASYDRAQMDGLTEIFNKAALLSQGKEIFERARSTNTPLVLTMFDLDNFKKVNDNYGHPAGDYVLKELASIISNSLRREDFFARYGGEEFCILLVGTALQRGLESAERIRSIVEKHAFKYKGTLLDVTISVGVAELDATMKDFEALVEKADQASYVSKKNGKNRVSSL
jgi:diguanylate cyclase (GGDEF)-like protein